MIVRALDVNNDWQFGKGRNDYKKDIAAVAQNIKTRLQSFLGDCFFDLGAGIDWFNLLGSKNRYALNLAVRTNILNTNYVTGISELTAQLETDRKLTLQYSVKTVFPGTIHSAPNFGDLLTDELGNILTTEAGEHLHV